jgi:hypothetical protein
MTVSLLGKCSDITYYSVNAAADQTKQIGHPPKRMPDLHSLLAIHCLSHRQ